MYYRGKTWGLDVSGDVIYWECYEDASLIGPFATRSEAIQWARKQKATLPPSH